MDSDFVQKVVEDTVELKQGTLSRSEYNKLYKIIHRDCETIADAERLYFVIGNFDRQDGRRERLENVRDCISEYPNFEAFLMDEIDEDDEMWANWYLKFEIFYRRADDVVAVVEDNDGGHELEIGEVDNDELWILKRDYYNSDGTEDTETEHEMYDGMLAKLFEHLERHGQVYHWTIGGVHGCDNLDQATRRVVEETR